MLELHRRYLAFLGVEVGPPDLDLLRRLTRAHLERVPFENISKLWYLRTRGLRDVPDLELFVEGLERRGFGGTCYSNNPHFAGLLRALGFDVDLCGADMDSPDVHTALIVRIDGREWLVDTSYAAPLLEPFDRALGGEVRCGEDRWVVDPPDAAGRSLMTHHRGGERRHGYLLKPEPREPAFFEPAVRDSYRPDATFMTQVLLIRSTGGGLVRIANLRRIEATEGPSSVTRLPDRAALVEAIEEDFGIAAAITREAIADCALRGEFDPA